MRPSECDGLCFLFCITVSSPVFQLFLLWSSCSTFPYCVRGNTQEGSTGRECSSSWLTVLMHSKLFLSPPVTRKSVLGKRTQRGEAAHIKTTEKQRDMKWPGPGMSGTQKAPLVVCILSQVMHPFEEMRVPVMRSLLTSAMFKSHQCLESKIHFLSGLPH